jgi:hypothetical protein
MERDMKIVKVISEWNCDGCRWINALCDDGLEHSASACWFDGVHYPTAESFIERGRERDIVDQKIIRTALEAGLYWLHRSTRPNSEVDKAFMVYEQVKQDVSKEANDKLGTAIYGAEWHAV